MSIINIKHSGNSGDVIYALSAIKAACEKNLVRANIYLEMNRPAFYYEGAKHPVYDPSGRNVMLNQYMVDMLKPLLEAQEYIKFAHPWQGEKIQVNMDRIRDVNIGIPYGEIRKWYSYVYCDMAFDSSLPCIDIPPRREQCEEYGDYILVNRTERYTNVSINYMFLREYPRVIFAGTDGEYALFRTQVPNAARLMSRDFLELAEWIAHAKVFVGNQSMCFAIAEQMKTNRVLEVCSYAPNVIPSGPNGYDFYTQSALEHYVEKLWKGERP